MAHRSKFVTSSAERLGLTHFLAIPLVTPTSRTQVRDSFRCLWDDLAAIGPTDAIRPLGLLTLNFGIALSLKTPERMAKAKKILQQLSIEYIQPTSHKSSTSGTLSRHASSASPTFKDDINNSMAPPRVSISGLFCRPGTEAEVLNLSTKVYDPTHRVRKWRLRLAHAYQAAGLSPQQQQPKRRDATVCLTRIPSSKDTVPCPYNPGKLMHPRLTTFDARGLLERYKEHVWIGNAPLERVSLCRIGLRRLGVEELQEDVSVPL